jgi:hypothetical protein
MHHRLRWIALIALGALTAPVTFATTVYRWTDADGVIHFSDQPEPGAEKVPIGPTKLYGTPKSTTKQVKKGQEPPKPMAAHLGYTSVAVISPGAERTFFDEPIPVSLGLTPALQDGHSLTWFLNGTPLEQNSESFTIPYLDRGAYTIYATITDNNTGESTSSAPVSFYVQQPSVLSPQHPKK